MKIHRTKHGRGFSYRYDAGERLQRSSKTDQTYKRWIESLAIPPAWQEVVIDTNRAAKVYVSGRDQAGKKQYIYNPRWRDKRDQEKFARIQRFAEQLPTMRRITGQQLSAWESAEGDARERLDRDTVLACMVRLLDAAYFRPGNEQYTKDNESYGLTTLRSKHLQMEGDELVFEYQGKSGVEQKKSVESARLSKVIAELDETPGYRIFKYFEQGEKIYVNSEDLNAYIRSIMGEEFSAKDFRTWAGTAVAALALAEFDVTDDETERDKNILKSVKKVAKLLGNTPTICRANYIDPRILEAYIDGTTIAHIKKNISQKLDNEMLSFDELATLTLLKNQL